MRPLPPTLRENRRYILIKIDGAVPIQKDIYRAAADAVRELFGDAGAAEMHPAVVWSEGAYAVVRCTRGFEQKCIAALACVTKAGGAPTVFRTVAVSGTICGAKKHMKK
ncbi:MAG: Rpp14/Pop5 family protein [Methanocorpusculum sp.]|nr:Rpp14/Pop5 family protein [Methanocorpusculum sp.]